MRKREWSIKTERDFLAYISLLIAENAGFKDGSRLGFCIFQMAWSKSVDTCKTRGPAAFALRKKNIGSRVWYLSFGCPTRRIKLPHVWSMFSGRFIFFDNIIMVVFIIITLRSFQPIHTSTIPKSSSSKAPRFASAITTAMAAALADLGRVALANFVGSKFPKSW